MRAALQALADAAADAAGEPRRTVPVLAPHAVGDQLAVLGRDVLDLAPTDALDGAAALLADLRRALP